MLLITPKKLMLKILNQEEEFRLKYERDHLVDVLDSLQVEVDDCELRLDDVDDHDDDLEVEDDKDEEEEEDLEDEEEEEEEEEDEDYAFPIGPMPQNITNDLKSLDEMVGNFFN